MVYVIVPVTGSKTITISKANNTLTLSSTSGTLTYPTAKNITVTNPSGGALSCSSSNTAAVTCSVSGNKVTVTPGTTAATGVTITISSAATTNYNAGSTTYTATSKKGTIQATVENVTVEYDGEAHGITVNVTSPTGTTIKYGTTNGAYNLDASPTRLAVGRTTVYYQITKAGYTTVTGSAKITITAAQPHYAFGDPTLSSTTDYTQVTYPSGVQARVFAKLEGGQKSVCILYNFDHTVAQLYCFDNNNYENEKINMSSAFSRSGFCSQNSEFYLCCNIGATFCCRAATYGSVSCDDSTRSCLHSTSGLMSCS